jgi:hypothetical protein
MMISTLVDRPVLGAPCRSVVDEAPTPPDDRSEPSAVARSGNRSGYVPVRVNGRAAAGRHASVVVQSRATEIRP